MIMLAMRPACLSDGRRIGAQPGRPVGARAAPAGSTSAPKRSGDRRQGTRAVACGRGAGARRARAIIGPRRWRRRG